MADEDSISDEELEAELRRELEAERAAKEREEAALNATNAINQTASENASTILGDSGSAQFDGGAQLTTFQDNIITTGSDRVENPIDDATALPAEDVVPFNPNYSHTSYAVYNTVFEEKKLYELKKAEGAPQSVLQELLLKRAIKCIEKARVIQRDGQGIRKNWNMDLVPREVWYDFNAAQRNLNQEIENVVQESKRCRFMWGPKHRDNIFSQAREYHDKKMAVQTRVFQQKMMKKKEAHRLANGTKSPGNKDFGKGLQSGFFNNSPNNASDSNPGGGPPKKKMSKKQLRKEKKQLKKQEQQQAALESAGGMRRRKPKHRFTNK